MIPEGTWKARGGQWALTKAKSSGNVGAAVEIILLEGPAQGSRLTWYGYFTDKAFDRVVESLRLLGWTGDDLSDLTGVDSNEVNAVIGYEQDPETGELKPKVQWINALGGVAVSNRLNAAEAAAFAQNMRGRLHAMKQSQAQSNAPPSQRPTGAPPRTDASAPVDDDIPFLHNEAEQWGEEWERWTAKRAARRIV